MNVSLTPVLEKMVQAKVASGLYNSASEVVREALRLLVEHERMQQAKLEALREEVDIGLKDLDNGRFTEYDKNSSHKILEEIKSRRK